MIVFSLEPTRKPIQSNRIILLKKCGYNYQGQQPEKLIHTWLNYSTTTYRDWTPTNVFWLASIQLLLLLLSLFMPLCCSNIGFRCLADAVDTPGIAFSISNAIGEDNLPSNVFGKWNRIVYKSIDCLSYVLSLNAYVVSYEWVCWFNVDFLLICHRLT